MTLFPLTGATWRELSANWNSANCELKSGNSVRQQSAVAQSPQSPGVRYGRVRCQSAVRQGPQSLQSALELWRCISAAA
eukprot:gene6486-biopygen3290